MRSNSSIISMWFPPSSILRIWRDQIVQAWLKSLITQILQHYLQQFKYICKLISFALSGCSLVLIGSVFGYFFKCLFIFFALFCMQYLRVCPGSSDPFYIVSYYINWVTLPGHIVCQAFGVFSLPPLATLIV